MHKSFGGLCKFSSTPHDEGAGRGPRRGATPKTPSSIRWRRGSLFGCGIDAPGQARTTCAQAFPAPPTPVETSQRDSVGNEADTHEPGSSKNLLTLSV